MLARVLLMPAAAKAEVNSSVAWSQIISAGSSFCSKFAQIRGTQPLHLVDVVVTQKEDQYVARCAGSNGRIIGVPFSLGIDTAIIGPHNIDTMQTIMAVTKDPSEPAVADAVCALVTPDAKSEKVTPRANSVYEIACIMRPQVRPVPQSWKAFSVMILYRP